MKHLAILLVLALPLIARSADAPVAGEADETKDIRHLFREGLFEEDANRNFDKAAAAFSGVVKGYQAQRQLAATALFHFAEIRLKQGNKTEAITAYQRLLTEFPDATAVADLSRKRLADLNAPAPARESVRSAAEISDAEERELASVRDIAKNSPDLLNAVDNGNTHLSRAAGEGWLEVARFLLDHGAKLSGIPNAELPLFAAASGGRKAMVELLLARGADVNARRGDGTTALIEACSNGRTEVARLLIERGADINAATLSGYTALAGAVLKDAELTRILLERGANPNTFSVSDRSSVTPLMGACGAGNEEIVKLLLDHRADPNLAAPETGQTALLIATEKGSERTVEQLLTHGAKTDLANKAGFTALHFAAAAPWRPALVRMLLDHGAPPSAATTDGGLTPLHISIASANGKPELARDAARLREVWEALLAKGAEINKRNSFGSTVLHLAIGWADLPPDSVLWLIEHGADITLKNKDDRTPIDLASGERRLFFEQRFVFPKLRDEHAITVALQFTGSLPIPEPLHIEAEPEGATPPDLGSVLRQALLPPGAPSQLSPSLPSAPGAPRAGIASQLLVPPKFEALVFRGGQGKPFEQAARVVVDLEDKEAKPIQWPQLRWDDVVVLFSQPTGSGIASFAIDQWLTDHGVPPAFANPAQPGDPPFAIRAVASEKDTEYGGDEMKLGLGSSSETVRLKPTILMDELVVKSASVERTPEGNPVIEIHLNEEGTAELARITKLFAGKRIGIIVSGRLLSAPVVQQPITSGTIQIAGNLTESQAKELVAQLNRIAGQGRFVTTVGERKFFNRKLSVLVQVEHGGLLSWHLDSDHRSCGGGDPGIDPESPWFIYAESLWRVWVFDGKKRLTLVSFEGNDEEMFKDVSDDPQLIKKAPKPVADRYLAATTDRQK